MKQFLIKYKIIIGFYLIVILAGLLIINRFDQLEQKEKPLAQVEIQNIK